MMIRLRTGLLAAVLLATTACHRTENTDKLAALDSAYKSGLLTQEEYEAKKLALTTASPMPTATQAPVPTQAFVPAVPQPVVPSVAPTPADIPAPVIPPVPAAARTPKATPPSAPPRRVVGEPVAPVLSPIPPSPSPNVSSVSPSAASPRENAHVEPPRNRAEEHEPEPAPLAGCEDVEYKSGGQKGSQSRFFAASPDAVWRAAVSSLESLDFNIHKSSNKEIEASKKRHVGVIVGAGGERVILSLRKAERGNQSGTLVIGETKKSLVGRMAQRTWTDAVLAQMACKLREVGH